MNRNPRWDNDAAVSIGHHTVGIMPGVTTDFVWVAQGAGRDRWPGLLFGGLGLRRVPHRYAQRALRLFADNVRRTQAGEPVTPLPDSYLGLKNLLASRTDLDRAET